MTFEIFDKRRVNISNSFALCIVSQIAGYYNSERERIPRIPWANIFAMARAWHRFFSSPWTLALSAQFVATHRILTMWSAFRPPTLKKAPDASWGLERLVETLLCSSLTAQWLPTLFLNREKRARCKKNTQKKRKALDSIPTFYTSCKMAYSSSHHGDN